MITRIPPTEFAQIVQTNSSPAIIAALLNEAEEKYSSTPRHFNAKRVYPYWKICQVCLKPFPCMTREQAARNRTCSDECTAKQISQSKTGQKSPRSTKVEVTCEVCGKTKLKPLAWARRVKNQVCSRHCNGILRGEEWKKHAHKGRAAWTDESRASYQEKMSGPNNPAWKGGVTYFKTHGNYTGVKYVRCPAEFRSMARKDGYVMEHRLIVAQAIGRPLLRTEVVHHVDHNPANNALTNLELFESNAHHKLYEHHGTPLPLWRL